MSVAAVRAPQAVAPVQPVLEVRGLSKAYGGVHALEGVDLVVLPGRVHAIVGENGAGKSTLVNILSGTVMPDAGAVEVDGRAVAFQGPADAARRGIATVHQELSLVDMLSVADNIFGGRPPTRFGLVDRRTRDERARRILGELGFAVDPRARVGDLPPGTRQLVEIAKAVAPAGIRAVLFDEPTSALAHDERRALFGLIATLKAQGLGIVYISHHLPEVLALADHVSVLRDGRNAAELDPRQASEADLVSAMVGREIGTMHGERRPPGDVALALSGLTVPGHCEDVEIHLRRGEIVCLAGLMGSGRSAVLEAVAGLLAPSAGTFVQGGRDGWPASLRDAMARGIGYVPHDRKQDGLFIERSIEDNLVVASQERARRGVLHDGARARRLACDAVERYAIKASGPSAPAASLSGGNQQRVLLAKWLERKPEILLVDEPTRGVDVGSKAGIHALLRERALEGMALLLVSSDLPEILQIADRILVMRHGRIVGAFAAGEATEDAILALASGIAPDPAYAKASPS